MKKFYKTGPLRITIEVDEQDLEKYSSDGLDKGALEMQLNFAVINITMLLGSIIEIGKLNRILRNALMDAFSNRTLEVTHLLTNSVTEMMHGGNPLDILSPNTESSIDVGDLGAFTDFIKGMDIPEE